MLIRACIFLFSCFLAAVPGCDSKSETTQPTAVPQQASSPQQSAPASGEAVSNSEQKQPPGAETGATSATRDACALLTKAEIEEVQGEPVKDMKSSSREGGSFAISQCFYSVATFTKSVSLELTQSSKANANQTGPKEFWEKTFHRKKGEEEEEREKGEEEEEREKGGEARPVPGVGDEAFWSGNQRAGALYVLKNNAFIRISIGGSGEEAAKIAKAKALAQKAVKRL